MYRDNFCGIINILAPGVDRGLLLSFLIMKFYFSLLARHSAYRLIKRRMRLRTSRISRLRVPNTLSNSASTQRLHVHSTLSTSNLRHNSSNSPHPSLPHTNSIAPLLSYVYIKYIHHFYLF